MASRLPTDPEKPASEPALQVGMGDAVVRACLLAVVGIPAIVIAFEIAWRWRVFVLVVLGLTLSLLVFRLARRAP
jgi:hypothetical protein